MRSGGLACLIDVDNGLSATYPEPSAAYRRLAQDLTAMQEQAGGGRHVARALAARLDAAGFDVLGVQLIPVAQYWSSQPGDVNRTFLVERFRTARNDMVGQFISEDEFDKCLDRFAAEIVPAECVAGPTSLSSAGAADRRQFSPGESKFVQRRGAGNDSQVAFSRSPCRPQAEGALCGKWPSTSSATG